MSGPRRLQLGCGLHPQPDWINSDLRSLGGVALRFDLRSGVPLADGSIDFAVANHVLQDLGWRDLLPALREVLRVLRPGGVLRLGLPDLDRALDAYRLKDAAYFSVPDQDARSLGGKLISRLVWYGVTRTPFTYDFAAELLQSAGFAEVARCGFKRTASRFPEIVELDSRPGESLFIEGTK